MEYRILGRTGLSVSVMGLGCGGHSRLGLRQDQGDANAIAIVRRAREQGINFIDTAEAYGTEGVVGKALALEGAGLRDTVVISTKVSPRQGDSLRTRAQIQDAAEGCLRRLQTDYVDVLHLHGVSDTDYDYCAAELVPALQGIRDAGNIRFLGITEAFGPDPQHKMLTRAIADDCWDVMMVGFNLINQSARERIFPTTQAKSIGILDMFAVRRALHTLESLQPLLDDLQGKGALSPEALAEAHDEKGRLLGFLAENDAPLDLPDVAYRFCRDEPGVHVVLSGTGNPAHLDANIASLSRPLLPASTTERLRRIFAGIDSVSGN